MRGRMALGRGREALKRKVLQRTERKDLNQPTLFLVPLKVFPNVWRNIARNLPLQQETVHFCSTFDTASVQDETLLRNVWIVSKRPQGKPARHINGALGQRIRNHP